VSVAWRTSPEEDSIAYKTVRKPRRPKDTRMALPDSYWQRNGGCQDMTATGVCGGQVVGLGPMRCYWHAKVLAEPGVRLPGSIYNSNGALGRMPPAVQTRKRAQHD
jgi:hypothetical protein